MPFTTLTDEEEKELYRLSRFYWREALRCEEAKAYLEQYANECQSSPAVVTIGGITSRRRTLGWS